MEGRLRILFLNRLLTAVLMFCATGFAWSAETTGQQQVIQPEVERRTIDIDKIDTEDFEIGIYAGVLSVEDFGANSVVGARVAYHVTEDVFFEAAYAKTDTSETSWELLSGGAQLLSDDDRELTYYNISVGYNLFLGEAFIGKNWAFNSALYVIGGVGNTSFAGEDQFTGNIGAGYRFLATDWLAVHVDARDHIFETDLIDKDKTTHNLEMTAGITVFF